MSDRVRVQVSRVDLDARKIDFRLVRDTPIKPPVARGIAADKGEGAGPHVRALPAAESGASMAGPRRRKAAPAQSAAVQEARAARGTANKHGVATKAASKQARKKR
jgi:ribonuclease R